jgi:hypothetical protein
MAEAAADCRDAADDPLVVLGDTFAVRAEARTVAPVGGESQTELAELVGLLAMRAKVAKISSPEPMIARPMSAANAAGLRSSALTRCNLASVNGPGTEHVARLRHSTHELRVGSRALTIDTKG